MSLGRSKYVGVGAVKVGLPSDRTGGESQGSAMGSAVYQPQLWPSGGRGVTVTVMVGRP